jgi:hypothetical protein
MRQTCIHLNGSYILMALTYRSHPKLQRAFAFMGPTLAFGLAAVTDNTHPSPQDRFCTLLNWAAVAEREGMIAPGSTRPGETFWTLLQTVLQHLQKSPDLVTSPVQALLTPLEGLDGLPEQACKEFVDVVLQWCTFGSITRVRNSVRVALGKLLSSDSPRNRALGERLLTRMVDETRHLEKTLGFAESFRSLYPEP